MMVAAVTDTDKRRYEFATWAQAEAFALAAGSQPRITISAEIAVLQAAGVDLWRPLVVLSASDYAPAPALDSHGSILVGADWLDATFGGES